MSEESPKLREAATKPPPGPPAAAGAADDEDEESPQSEEEDPASRQRPAENPATHQRPEDNTSSSGSAIPSNSTTCANRQGDETDASAALWPDPPLSAAADDEPVAAINPFVGGHAALSKTASIPLPPGAVGREDGGRGRSLPRNVEAPPASSSGGGYPSPLLLPHFKKLNEAQQGGTDFQRPEDEFK